MNKQQLQFNHLNMNGLLSLINNSFRIYVGQQAGWWQLFVPKAAEQTHSPTVHMLTDVPCYRGAKDNTSVLLCPWSGAVPQLFCKRWGTCG